MTNVLGATSVLRRALCVLCVAGVHLGAQDSSDSAAVIRVAEASLRALGDRSVEAMRAVLLPGAQFVAVLQPPAGVPSRARLSVDTAVYASLRMEQTPMLERMWAPVVRLSGRVATVTAPYDFHRDGKFTHCGVDVFTLVKVGETWKISAITYTVQATGCAPSPLGPPAAAPE
jgi:hypothetical protein